MRRLNVDPHLGCAVEPAAHAPLTGKDQRVLTVIFDDGQFEVHIVWCRSNGLPHELTIGSLPFGQLISVTVPSDPPRILTWVKWPSVPRRQDALCYKRAIVCGYAFDADDASQPKCVGRLNDGVVRYRVPVRGAVQKRAVARGRRQAVVVHMFELPHHR